MSPPIDETTPLRYASGLEPDPWACSADKAWLGRVWRSIRNNDKALAYTVLTTLATVPTLLFARLHMAAFLDMHGITLAQVAAAHVVFVVLNTVNDVFAGYITDAYAARCGTRLGFVCGVQAIWVLTTSLPFFQLPAWMTSGAAGAFYYFVCISVQDCCLSLIGGARATLMAEITSTEGECIHLKRLSSILGNAEAVVNLLGYALWSAQDPKPFLGFLCGVSAFALLCNFWSAWRLRCYTPRAPATGGGSQAAVRAGAGAGSTAPPLLAFMRSLPRNVWVYIAVTALHELQGVAWGQFAVPLLELLLAESSKAWRVLVLGGISGVGGVVAFLMTWPAEWVGLYSVLLWTFRLKVGFALVFGVVAAVFGFSGTTVCCCMLLNEASMAMLTGFHLVIMVSLMEELAAERRAGGAGHPLAAYPSECGPALLMGVSAFFVKPFNSVGPVLGTALLAHDGKGTGKEDIAEGQARQVRAFMLLLAMPLATGALQWLLWGRLFTLRGRPAAAARDAARNGG